MTWLYLLSILLFNRLATGFTNPVLWEDTPDIDIIRVNDTFYYSASSFHQSPGAPILRSYNLFNWEYAGHSVPVLDYSSSYNLVNGRAYVQGIWASFFNYRASSRTFYWGGCIRQDGRTHIYTASAVEGPWTRRGTINSCYYDAGILFDDDDTPYVAYGNTEIFVAQLSSDGFSQVRSQRVFQASFTLEGSRFYKRNGAYYIFLTRPADGQFILKSTSGPFGPYTLRPLLDRVAGPIAGGGVPHQGGLVQTQNGDWYYLAFIDAYPGGRVPALAPITWSSDGWPVLTLVNGAWGATYPDPRLPAPPRSVKSPTGTDRFTTSVLGHEWEWNHNPDNSRWSAGNGLRLSTATVTYDIYQARNTLTHRILGPSSTATIELNYSEMRDGDRAGLALLRDSSTWIGIARDSGACRVAVVSNIIMSDTWATTNTGSYTASSTVSCSGRIFLRAAADVRPRPAGTGRFSYSTDGNSYTSLGSPFTFKTDWRFFLGYRFAIFNYATSALGGSITVPSFTLSTP